MNDPYAELGLPPDADQATVRQRYLELVRRFSPDRSPAEFARIRAAYDDLQDPLKHLEKQLFSASSEESLDVLIAEVRKRLQTVRIPTETLLSLGEH